MILTAEQNLRIALLYEKAAADRLGVPPQQRTAFARKAKWFRMKARIRAKKEAVSAPAEQRMNGTARLDEARLDEACLDEAWLGDLKKRPRRYRSIAERIAAARAAQS